MVFEGYIKIDPNDPSTAQSWTVRGMWEDRSKFKDRSKHYILVVVRDTLGEAVLETDKWVKIYNEGGAVPDTLGEVWRNYFEWAKATASVRKQNGHLKLEAKEKFGDLVKGKQGRPAGKYDGEYNIFNRKNDPEWTTKVLCTTCGHKVRPKIYEIRHGANCKCKPLYVKKKYRTENQSPQHQVPPNL
jgi:hypothetical protein